MSGIRKYNRRKAARNSQKKTKTKTSLWEVLMIAGGAMLLVGVLVCIFSYTTYTAGRSEQILDGLTGRTYYPEEAPGDPGRKLQAYISLATASIGSLLLLVSVTAYIIGRRLRRTAEDVTYDTQ